MSKEIIINADKNQTRIALIESGELIELYIEDGEHERTLGDIYLGRIRRTMPSIQAAFVDIGQKQDAFLHYSDLADNLPQWLELLQQNPPRVESLAASIEENPQPMRPRGSRGSRGSSSTRRPKRLSRSEKKAPSDNVAKPDQAAQQKNGGQSNGKKDQPPGNEPEPVTAENGKESAEAPKSSRPPSNVRRRPTKRRNNKKQPDIDPQLEAAEVEDAKGKAKEEAPQKDTKNGKGSSSKRNQKNAKNSRSQKKDRPPLDFQPQKHLEKGKHILVKIVKEPISAKGSRVSTDISLAGRFLVLVPLANYVAVSKKIYSYKERRRLRALAKSLLPAGFGVIVRTVAEGKKAKELDTDLRLLLEKWRKIENNLETAGKPPVLVHEDVNMASSVIRDLFSDDYDRILIDDPKLYRNVKNYVQAVAPHMVPGVQLYKGKKHVFKSANIAKDINQAFESRVDLPSGGYLFIEHTEAMHVVDVNSGRAGRGLSQEENSLKVDLEAVHSIAKQIRLRDLGGIIVIDFIDLREERNRKKVYYELRKAFRRDRAVTKILPMSDFGLVEITRQRLRPSITKTFSGPEEELQPTQEEKKAEAPKQKERPRRSINIEEFIMKVERWIAAYKAKSKGRVVHLRVHPFAAAYMNQKIPTLPIRWFMKHFIRVRLIMDETLDPLEFRFVDPNTGKDLSRPRPQKRRGGKKNRPGRTPASSSKTK
ncbi:MAG: Rne/Rng family ribonuclease [Rhodothermaceae bacterium]|nr:Rne/Rng family ribonuclease [Rhodothermaceae bacterium]